MLPVFKYPGGKRRELPFIKSLLPRGIETTCEPFAGGAAFSLSMELPTILADIDPDVRSVYRAISYDWAALRGSIRRYTVDKDPEATYYELRALDPDSLSTFDRAARFIYLRQMAFSGMIRKNSEGKDNVPFGKGKVFDTPFMHSSMGERYGRMFWYSQVEHCRFEDAIDSAEQRKNCFIFCDPPYLDRVGYGAGTRDGLHEDLAAKLRKVKNNFMVVHLDCPEYRELYKGFNFYEKEFRYSLSFRNRVDEERANVKHVYITNYAQRDWIF